MLAHVAYFQAEVACALVYHQCTSLEDCPWCVLRISATKEGFPAFSIEVLERNEVAQQSHEVAAKQ